jgi:OmpA-OmpF porin, OOP family
MRVVDQIAVGGVVTPPQWLSSVQRLLTSDLKHISRGELRIDGAQVTVKGQTENELLRQQDISQMATLLSLAYTVKNGLRVADSQ